MAGSKWASDTLLDLLLQYLEDNVDRISVCEEGCTTYEHATSTKGVATGKKLAISSTPTFTGPVDDAILTGRKTTIDEEAAITVDANGTPAEVCLCKSGTTTFLYKTSCTGAALVSGNTVTVPAWKINIPDPT